MFVSARRVGYGVGVSWAETNIAHLLRVASALLHVLNKLGGSSVNHDRRMVSAIALDPRDRAIKNRACQDIGGAGPLRVKRRQIT